MRRKSIVALALTATMAISMSMTAFAGNWEQTGTDWKYDDNGTYMTGWKWIDGKSYYFDGNGIMAKATVIDGYELNADGQWIVNGVVQTQGNQTENTGVNHSSNYDPAHPLAGKIDEWNLRLPSPYLTSNEVSTSNIQAMLTGQMDQYYAAPIGESVNPVTGTKGYVTETDYNNTRKYENDLYNWYCNWLNGISFENMSEMDRAKEIQKVLASAKYQDGAVDYSNAFRSDYAILINKSGHCSEFTMTARSLAKAMGLKSGVAGNANHSWYYIQVDGKVYSGENECLNLNYPTSDYAVVD